jgi:putative hemolysin
MRDPHDPRDAGKSDPARIDMRRIGALMGPALALMSGAQPGAKGIARVPAFPPFGEVVRDLEGLAPSLGRIGALEVRLATTRSEIRSAQKLRYKVFYEEMSATPGPAAFLSRRDKDAFDRVCDHLLVIDHEAPPANPLAPRRPQVVGTYRLLRQSVADRNFGFYTASEFAIGPTIAAHPELRFLELGRSCVLPPYRNKRTVELLWHGIWTYVLHHRIDVMLGCASLEGTDPAALALPLSFLHHFAGATGDWAIRALDDRRTPMDLMPKDVINPKQALQSLPPLIKGYLRLGAKFGDGAVVDRQFGTTDVLVVLRVADIDRRYITYYGADASRHAA